MPDHRHRSAPRGLPVTCLQPGLSWIECLAEAPEGLWQPQSGQRKAVGGQLLVFSRTTLPGGDPSGICAPLPSGWQEAVYGWEPAPSSSLQGQRGSTCPACRAYTAKALCWPLWGLLTIMTEGTTTKSQTEGHFLRRDQAWPPTPKPRNGDKGSFRGGSPVSPHKSWEQRIYCQARSGTAFSVDPSLLPEPGPKLIKTK